eukprot:348899-Pelagomonas_calceolata.AAC.1
MIGCDLLIPSNELLYAAVECERHITYMLDSALQSGAGHFSAHCSRVKWARMQPSRPSSKTRTLTM